jgi:hypothetical protein
MNLQREKKQSAPGEEKKDDEDQTGGDISEGYEHIEKSKEGEKEKEDDGQVVDAATDEQAAERPAPTNEKEGKEDEAEARKEDEDVVMAEEGTSCCILLAQLLEPIDYRCDD